MDKPIVWSPSAYDDFESILNYLQNTWGDKVLYGFIDITEMLLMQISNNPKQFPIIHKHKKIRKCVITKHCTLYYRDRKECVDVLRFYDNRQDPIKLIFH